jgi:hypothetical protein
VAGVSIDLACQNMPLLMNHTREPRTEYLTNHFRDVITEGWILTKITTAISYTGFN